MLDQCFLQCSPQMLIAVSKGTQRSTKIDTKLNKCTAGLLRTFDKTHIVNLLKKRNCAAVSNLITELFFILWRLIFLGTRVWKMLMMEELRFGEVK